MNGPVKVDHRDPLVKTLSRSLRERCKVRPGARLLVAVSGGADSVALLRALTILAARSQWRLSLAVGHVQHHLREEAEGDAIFVQSLAGELKLPCLRADLNPAEFQGNVEAAARRGRYEALGVMSQAFDADAIVTAHHGEDQLETMLMRMLRGSSVRGFSGMAWRRRLRSETGDSLGSLDEAASLPSSGSIPRMLLRPMLAVDRTEIVRFLTVLGQPWCEDATNTDTARLRARLRRDVLPVLRELKTDAAARACELSDQLREAARMVEAAVTAVMDRVVMDSDRATLDRTDARMLSRIVITGVLRRLILHQGGSADRLSTRALSPLIRAIRDTTGGDRMFQFTGGVTVHVTRGQVVIQRAVHGLR